MKTFAQFFVVAKIAMCMKTHSKFLLAFFIQKSEEIRVCVMEATSSIVQVLSHIKLFVNFL